MNELNYINTSLKKIKLNLSEESIDKLYHFYKLVTEKNKVMNLTAIMDYEEFVTKHIVDSLSINLLIDESSALQTLINADKTRILDLGSGAGFPGIPLAIVYPNPEYTLLDSLEKRTIFLNDSVAELNLSNYVKSIHGRAEEIARLDDYREQYDICVSRAVAKINTLAEYTLPFVKPGGYFIAYKADSQEELKEGQNAIEILGGEVEKEYSFNLPDTEITRKFIIIKKIKSTPDKYPRKAGKPKKKPL